MIAPASIDAARPAWFEKRGNDTTTAWSTKEEVEADSP